MKFVNVWCIDHAPRVPIVAFYRTTDDWHATAVGARTTELPNDVVEQHAGSDAYRLRCERCGLELKRDVAVVHEALDRLAATDLEALSLRALVRTLT